MSTTDYHQVSEIKKFEFSAYISTRIARCSEIFSLSKLTDDLIKDCGQEFTLDFAVLQKWVSIAVNHKCLKINLMSIKNCAPLYECCMLAIKLCRTICPLS